jgi:hypothetical protein
MKNFLSVYAAITTLLLIIFGAALHHRASEVKRLDNNYKALSSKVDLYQNRLDESAASVIALQLELDEYKEQHKRDLRRIRALGVRPRRVESVATTATKSEVQYVAPLRDTIVVYDTVSIFRWSDRWVKAEGAISNGRVECKVESIDTLRQVIHRVPRRFGLIRYGTKAIRQEITSSNPHSQIVYTEYIELPKRREKR